MQNIIPYISKDGDIQMQVIFIDKIAYLNQKQLAEVFGVEIPAISKQLTNIFEDGELDENSVVSILEITASDGKTYKTKHYNSDVLISLGFRIQSKKAIEFRKWATNIINDFATKGIAINEPKLAQSPELLVDATKKLYRIKSEAHHLTKMCADIMALSIDYDKDSPLSTEFYIKVNARFCYAVTNNTPSEVKYYRADGTKPNMNATAFKGDKITKSEAKSARSYLTEKEYEFFCILVSNLYNNCQLDILRGEKFYMKDWLDKIDEILLFHKFPVLNHGGKVTAKMADKHIDTQFRILNPPKRIAK